METTAGALHFSQKMGITHVFLFLDKKASIRWQDNARRQFQAGLRGDVGL